MEELGYKGFSITQFQGLLAPAGTDPTIIARLHDEVVKASRDPDVVRKLVTEGGNDIGRPARRRNSPRRSGPTWSCTAG